MRNSILFSIIFTFLIMGCIRKPVGTYRNVNYSSDIIIIEHINNTEYKLTRGYKLPGKDKLKNVTDTKVKIDGNIMNYKGKNYDAFSSNYKKLVFNEGVFEKHK